MIRIPLYLAVAQWALLAALAVLVVVMFRQLGRLMAGGAKTVELGPATGSLAAPLTYVRAGSQQPERLVPGAGQPLLLAFVDPTCPSCEHLVTVLDAMNAAAELAGIRVLLLISDPPSYIQISEIFTATRLEIGRPAKRDGLAAYKVSGTPLLVAVDGVGLVRAAGSVVAEPEVRAFAQSCLLPPAEVSLPVVAAGAVRARTGHEGAEPAADRQGAERGDDGT
jgi:hypothetical protein